MEFHRRASTHASSAILFPGAFNPPTRAHLALASAALNWAPEIAFVLPRAFPHKEYEGPGFTLRLEMLLHAAAEPAFSVASSGGGLFIEMVREARAADPALNRLFLLCGRDAAERIVDWRYPAELAIDRQLEEFELLVAPRGGDYVPPSNLAPKIHALHLEGWEEVSASEIRRRIACGTDWRALVPESIADLVEKNY